MKKILLLVFLLASMSAFSQGNWNLSGARNRWGNGIGFGNKDTSTYTNASDTNLLVLQYPGLLCYRHLLTDHWQILANYTSGGAPITPSDTASMLAGLSLDRVLQNGSSSGRDMTVGTITATTIGGTLSTTAQPNITQLGTLSSLTVTNSITAGSISTTGNITTKRIYAERLETSTSTPSTSGNWGYNSVQGTYIYTKAGSLYDFLLNDPNGNDIAHVPTGTHNLVVSGNVTGASLSVTGAATVGGNLIVTGAASALSLTSTNSIFTGSSATTGWAAQFFNNSTLAAGEAAATIIGNTGGTGYLMSLMAGSLPKFSVDNSGNITKGGVNTTGTINAAAATVTGSISAASFNGNVTASNVSASGITVTGSADMNMISISGTVLGPATSRYISTDGGFNKGIALNAVTGGSIQALVNNVYIGGFNASGLTVATGTIAGTLSTAAQPNITSVGTLTGLTVSGAVSFGPIASTGDMRVAGKTYTTATTVSVPNSTTTTVYTMSAGQGVGILTITPVGGNAAYTAICTIGSNDANFNLFNTTLGTGNITVTRSGANIQINHAMGATQTFAVNYLSLY